MLLYRHPRPAQPLVTKAYTVRLCALAKSCEGPEVALTFAQKARNLGTLARQRFAAPDASVKQQSSNSQVKPCRTDLGKVCRDPGKQHSLSCAVDIAVQQVGVRRQLAVLHAWQVLQALHCHPGQHKYAHYLYQPTYWSFFTARQNLRTTVCRLHGMAQYGGTCCACDHTDRE